MRAVFGPGTSCSLLPRKQKSGGAGRKEESRGSTVTHGGGQGGTRLQKGKPNYQVPQNCSSILIKFMILYQYNVFHETRGKRRTPPGNSPLVWWDVFWEAARESQVNDDRAPPLFLPLPSWLPAQAHPKEQQQRGHTRKEHVLSQSGSFSRMQKGDPVRGNGKK